MNERCRQFRAAYTPGATDPHRHRCAVCAEYAAGLDAARRAAVAGTASQRLFDELRAIPDNEERRAWGFGPVPLLPLPPRLRERLRRLAIRRPGAPPAWVLAPRYAIAASYALTVLLGLAFGNPASLAGTPATLAGDKLAAVHERARAELAEMRAAAGARLAEVEQAARSTYQESKNTLSTSVETTRAQITTLAGRVLPDGEPQQPAPESPPAGSKGESP